MNSLNELLDSLGISKVRLAKYLNVSRQMVYNYLELDSLNKWPKEKKLLLLKLLDIDDSDEGTIRSIKVTTDYLMAVENRLNHKDNENNKIEHIFNIQGLDKEEQTLLADIMYLLKDKLLEDKQHDNYHAVKYLYYMLQSMNNIPEVKYILGYMAKTAGFIEPDEWAFNEEQQYIFESILFSALTLYNNGGASRSRLAEHHKKFVQEINQKKEEKLGRTEQLNTITIQALKELGYTSMNESNAIEVIEKIAEIESRRV